MENLRGNMRNSIYVRKGEFALIENYELAKADNFKGWCIHHRDEYKVLPSGIEVFRTKAELIEIGRYYNCPANELIFMTLTDHQAYHMKHITKERRKNMSLSAKGRPKGSCSDEHRNNISLACKGKTKHWKDGNPGLKLKGKTWKLIDGKRVWLPKEGGSHEAK